MSENETAPQAAIYGCAGPALTDAEKAFFTAQNPFGFILFKRNAQTPDQVRALCADLRACVGRNDAAILIDQEGGPVRRLRPPVWREAPPMAFFGALWREDRAAARRLLRDHILLMAQDLLTIAVTVNCAPVLDIPAPGAHAVIGERAFAQDAEVVAELGRIAHDAFLDGGVFPVIKHIPGHGRATADSHLEPPTVSCGAGALRDHDFAPFKALKNAPFAMTAHIVYSAFDSQRPATTSKTVIGDVIRGEIGFEGMVMTDDLSMKALAGSLDSRTRDSLNAGCDLVLHGTGETAEMRAVAAGCRPMDEDALRRWESIRSARRAPRAISGAEAQRIQAALLDHPRLWRPRRR